MLQPPEQLVQATSRADFMRDEGTALYTYLMRTAMPEIIGAPHPQALTKRVCNDIVQYDFLWPEGIAMDIAARHVRLTKENPKSFERIYKFVRATKGPQIQELLRANNVYTYQNRLEQNLAEGYATIMHFPANLLGRASIIASNQGLPPIARAFEDIPPIYRSDWFGGVCTTAAMTANGVWGGFSTDQDNGEFSHKKLFDFDFGVSDEGLTTFTFSEKTVQYMRGLMAERNAQAIRLRKSASKEHAAERFPSGSTSGCPVAHDRPHFMPKNSDDKARLEAVTTYTSTPANEIMNFEHNGIIYGLNSVASMFDSCMPYIMRAIEQSELYGNTASHKRRYSHYLLG